MAELNAHGEVRAAGGVVLRHRGAEIEVLVVHRPQYDDWSLPKGKADGGEDDLSTALRAVREETGLECEAAEALPPVRYTDRFGRPKVVRYWVMRVLGGSFTPHDEVDEIRWVGLADAGGLLTYGRDADLVRRVATTVTEPASRASRDDRP
ncbi:MAG TPA: NUDIX hydrolase [Acidimicrobiales bacterium]|nr:NUDIX hydrolase [Acidimicrobiales bacterium]